MNIRLKLVLSAAALAAGCVLLAGCGGSASSASSAASSAASSEAASPSASEPAASVSAEENGASDAVASAVDALLEADPISNQFEITAMNIEYDFGLQAEDVVSYKGVKSNDNGDAGLVLVIEAADGKAEDIANQLTAYQQDQVAFYGNYAEFAQAQSNVENAVIAFKDNRVVMAIASNECTADLDSAVDSALNS
jgi:cytoskeletal protein RodZ